MTGAEALMRGAAGFAKSHPEGIGLVTVIEAHAPSPENDARARIAEFLGTADYVQASGVAFEGTGFRAAAVRSIVSGLTMLARQPFEHKVFDSVPRTMSWLVPELAKHVSVDFSADDAVGAIELFREHVDAEVPRRRD